MTKISIVFCGGVGIALGKSIEKAKFGFHEVVAIDTSHRSINHASFADKKLVITSDQNEKPVTFDDVEHLTKMQRQQVLNTIGDPHGLIIVAGLGGAAGTGISTIVAQLAKERGIMVLSFVTLPFEFEDGGRKLNGIKGMTGLFNSCHNVLAISNEQISATHGPNTPYWQMLGESAFALENYLWHTCGCLTRQGIVAVDFEDMRVVFNLKDEGCISRIGWGEASGSDKGLVAARKALAHPFLHPVTASEIRGASVSIRARHQVLKMHDVNAAMNEIKSYLPDDSWVLFSADYDDSLGEEMQLSIVLNSRPSLDLI
jgi:cell division protein FtsZ